MHILPTEFVNLMMAFTPVFSKGIFRHVQVLVVGAILAIGKRTVTQALRVCGLSGEGHFQNYHRVLNRAVWGSLKASRLLLDLLLQVFAPEGPLVFGLDDTIERRRGAKIRAKGIYRDPVRSSHSHFVKTGGLRWLSLMLLVKIPWAGRIWALPVLTALAPSERYSIKRKRPHKKLTDWARQMLLQLSRWVPQRVKIVVADSSFAAIELLHNVKEAVCVITRLRLDAGLYSPAPPRKRGQKGRRPIKGARRPKLTEILSNPKTKWTPLTVAGWYGEPAREVEIVSETALWYHPGLPPLPIRWVLVRDPKGEFEAQAFLCTKVDYSPVQILSWFVMRWQVEVTFEESRAHLGMETQQQWSDLAIARTTPALLGLFSLVTLLADQRIGQRAFPVRQAAWYQKRQPTFSDALAIVRQYLWQHAHFSMSYTKDESVKIPHSLFKRLTDTLCYAA